MSVGRPKQALESLRIALPAQPSAEELAMLCAAALCAEDQDSLVPALYLWVCAAGPVRAATGWYTLLRAPSELNPRLFVDLVEAGAHAGDDIWVRSALEGAIYALIKQDMRSSAVTLAGHLTADGGLDLRAALEPLQSLAAGAPPLPKHDVSQAATVRAPRTDAARSSSRSTSEHLLAEMRRAAANGRYGDALHYLRRARMQGAGGADLDRTEDDLRGKARRATLPRDEGPYARAKRAEHDNDLELAERYYRQALERGDKRRAALLDLAALLHRVGRTEDAIGLLEDAVKGRRNGDGELKAVLQQLANLLQHSGRHDRAIAYLKRIRAVASPSEYDSLDKRMALSFYRKADLHSMEDVLTKLLERSPGDAVAQRWLEGLRHARETNVFDRIDALLAREDSNLDARGDLSAFLRFHVERCTYKGLKPLRVEEGTLNVKDADYLDVLAHKLGVGRPRERGDYYLSAARILLDLGATHERRARIYLRNCCAALGDACLAEGKSRDVARAYYAEAFRVAPEWSDQLDVKLSQFILSHTLLDNRYLLDEAQRHSPGEALKRALATETIRRPVLLALLDASLNSRDVTRHIARATAGQPDTRQRLLIDLQHYLGQGTQRVPRNVDDKGFLERWEAGRQQRAVFHREVANIFLALRSQMKLEQTPAQLQEVERLVQRTEGLDRQRTRTVHSILQSIVEYLGQASYVERERLFNIIQKRIEELLREIEETPTALCLEHLYDYLQDLAREIDVDFQHVREAAEPDDLEVQLELHDYVADAESPQITCHISVRNPEGKSPAAKVCLRVLPTDEYRPERPEVVVSPSLGGGEQTTCGVPLVVTKAALCAKTFTLRYEISFQTRGGSHVSLSGRTLAVTLTDGSDFKQLDNPYVYANGGTVVKEEMFYGRDAFVDNLVAAIQENRHKSLVIYGQKRAGKSSILYHLRRRLRPPVLPVQFSMGKVATSLEGEGGHAALLFHIIQSINRSLRGFNLNPDPLERLVRPTLADLRDNDLIFHDYLADLCEALDAHPQLSDARLLLLIDEFTIIYDQIVAGKLPRTFMKFWKALIDEGHFGCVLVGQDSMRAFIGAFPNEFQVAEPLRVSYLNSDDAQALIRDPIRVPETGESRFRGTALKSIVDLTAGSPFYIQVFQNRLVNYMNRKRLTYVTDAHVEEVVAELLTGVDSLGSEQFDNLVNAGDSESAELPAADTICVLREIARASRAGRWCDRSALEVDPSIPLDRVLADLREREVIAQDGESRYRIRVELYKRWLLANHG